MILVDDGVADADVGGLQQRGLDMRHDAVGSVGPAADQVRRGDGEQALGAKTAIGGRGERQQRPRRALAHRRPVGGRGRLGCQRLFDPAGQEAQVALAADQDHAVARLDRRLAQCGEAAHRRRLLDEAGRRIAGAVDRHDLPRRDQRVPRLFIDYLTRRPAGTAPRGIGAQQQQASAPVVRRGGQDDRRIGQMVDQRAAILAQRRLGHPAQFAPLDLGGGALIGGVVAADRHDLAVLHLDTQRLFGIGGKDVEHATAQRQFARLVDALVGNIA